MPQPRDKKLSERERKRRDGTAMVGDAGSDLRPLSMSTPMHAWPVHECLVPENWSELGVLIELVVTRRSETGEFAAAIVLVDLGCLGVKNAHTMRFTTEQDYQSWLETVPYVVEPIAISLDLAAKIVRTALDYAASLGFRPHRDYQQAAPFLRDARPELAQEEVPTGLDGKPYFINGPYDDVARITRQLDRKVGQGNYTFLLGGPLEGLPAELLAEMDDPNAPS